MFDEVHRKARAMSTIVNESNSRAPTKRCQFNCKSKNVHRRVKYFYHFKNYSRLFII
jgi:hypothetical protein